MRKVLPYLKNEYMQNRSEKLLFQETQAYILKFNNLPTKEALQIAIQNKPDVFEDDFKDASEILNHLFNDTENSDLIWLIENTEKWCQEKAIHNAIMESISILDNKDKKQNKTKGIIPQLLTDALSVNFDPNVGHDYFEDANNRYEFYHRVQNLIPFDLDYFNKITGGGLAPKTLNVILAPPNAGKSLSMCHFAAAALYQNYNVLYISMEMSQERISSRIDANLLDLPLNTILTMSKDSYEKKIQALKQRVKGKLIVKEYPTASASATNFRALLNELNLKKQFKPHIIFVDYLNICCSSRLKMGSTVNSYTYVKAIAEELRGLAQEFNVPVVSATQTTRNGATNSDPDMTDTSESFGLPATVDNLWAFITNEELEKMNKIMVKQLKNRDNDVTKNRRFLIGIDRPKMRLYDIPESEQNLISDESKTPENVYKSVTNNLEKLKNLVD